MVAECAHYDGGPCRFGDMIRDRLLHEWRTFGPIVYKDDYVVRIQTTGFCVVLSNGPLGEMADEIIEREIRHHSSIGRSFEWACLSVDSPSDLLERLVRRGFAMGEKEVTAVLDLSQIALQSPLHEVRQVSDEATLADFRFVAEEVFQKDFSYTTNALRECLQKGSDGNVGFVAYLEGRPVSIGRASILDGAQFVGIFTGGTVPEARGKGCYRSVVWARAAWAISKGMNYLSVDARPSSLPILTSIGFKPILEQWPCTFEVEPIVSGDV